MARKPTNTGFVEKPKQKKREKLPFGQTTWVLNNLDDGMLEQLDEFEKTPPNLLDFLTDCVDKGIDVKCGYDSYSDGYQAVAMGSYKDFPSAGFSASGFSKHGSDDALFVLWYKVAIVCQFDLSSAEGRDKRSQRQRG